MYTDIRATQKNQKRSLEWERTMNEEKSQALWPERRKKRKNNNKMGTLARCRILCTELTEDIVAISLWRCICSAVQLLRVFATVRVHIRLLASFPLTPFASASSILKCQRRNLYNSDVNKSHKLCHFRCFSFDYRRRRCSAISTRPANERTKERPNKWRGKHSFRFPLVVMVCAARHCAIVRWVAFEHLFHGRGREVRIMGRLCQVNMYLAAPFCLR